MTIKASGQEQCSAYNQGLKHNIEAGLCSRADRIYGVLTLYSQWLKPTRRRWLQTLTLYEQRSGIHFFNTSACYRRSTNLPSCFQINRTLKKQRRVQSQTCYCSILPNFCFLFLYLCVYQESNCTCDWRYPEVEALPQGLHQSVDFTPNVQDLVRFDFSLWHVTLVPFTLNQLQF